MGDGERSAWQRSHNQLGMRSENVQAHLFFFLLPSGTWTLWCKWPHRMYPWDCRLWHTTSFVTRGRTRPIQ